MRKEQRQCIDCQKIGVKERHRCATCAKEYNRLRVKKYSKRKIEALPTSNCVVCNQPMKIWRDTQNPKTNKHAVCKYQESHDDIKVAKSRRTAREIAKKEGLHVNQYQVIHHVDENPNNNSLDNLWAMHPKTHARLHIFLRHHRSLWAKDQSKYTEDCWNILRAHLTTAWLETTSAKVIKISEIGQSAAEPLNSQEHEEGSEAMHGDPKVGNN